MKIELNERQLRTLHVLVCRARDSDQTYVIIHKKKSNKVAEKFYRESVRKFSELADKIYSKLLEVAK